MKTNYQKILDETLSQIKKSSSSDHKKPSLLLHACCGPCSSYVLEYLSSIFNITICYYNPNIFPDTEYFRRLNELKKFLTLFPAALQNNVQLLEMNYNQSEYFDAIRIKQNPELAAEPEKGERCRRCYYFRMKKAWDYAVSNNFDYFTTTLSISPFKDSEKLNVIGKELNDSTNTHTKYLFSDFKKRGGFKRSLELSSEYGLFRQYYCGCVYSKKSADDYKKSKETQTNEI